MSKQIAITEVAVGFRFLLIETFESVQGPIFLDRGTSLFETLAEISAADASQPMGDCATIAAHVAHVAYYLGVLEDHMFRRDLSGVDWARVWNEISAVNEAEWAAMLADLRETYARIMGHLDGAGEWEGTHELSCLLGVIAHSAYHLGEIRQMMCRLKG